MSPPDDMAKKNSTEGKVYSYIRFSTPEQKMGDSLRRQVAQAKAFAEEKGLEFDETLRDEGLSGFHGTHKQKGKLGEFLRRASSGQIPRGSYLVVENISRFSRENMFTALKTILVDLFGNGIKLQTLEPRATYDETTLDDPQFLALLIYIGQAHTESKNKSSYKKQDCAEKRAKARTEGIKITKRCHHWLKLADDRRSFHLIADAVGTVRMIFDLYPKIGCSRLVQKLNTEAKWRPPGRRGRPSNGWRMSYVNKILRDRAVLGEFQPHVGRPGNRKPEGDPILDYYPRIITDEQWYAVQQKIEANKGTGGPNNTARSIFQGLTICAYCGGPMYREGKGPKPDGGRYLVCDFGKRKHCDENGQVKCKPYRVSYDEFQDVMLENCHKLRPDLVLPDASQQKHEVEALKTRINAIQGELSDIEQKIDGLDEEIIGESKKKDLKNEDRISRWKSKLDVLETRRASLKPQLDIERKALQNAERTTGSFEQWQKNLDTLRKAIVPADAIEVRLQLRAHLKEFIEKIEIFANGFTRAWEYVDKDRGEQVPKRRHRKETLAPFIGRQPTRVDLFGEEMDAIEDEYFSHALEPDVFAAFREYVLQRRMSKEGRFYRVFFKTGKWLDMVPPKSLASGHRLIRGGARHEWEIVSPSLSLLWEVFSKKQKVQPKALKPQNTKIRKPSIT